MFMARVSEQLPELKVCSAGNVRTWTFDKFMNALVKQLLLCVFPGLRIGSKPVKMDGMDGQ